jgi:hypothetical protein
VKVAHHVRDHAVDVDATVTDAAEQVQTVWGEFH